ncbi:MAG: hypothetical protein DME59_11020 [Verrucomicrobia bacterium]|nr:MAG: hypothetical protein DME59_11020 [Verrucomicrobiota bacterium]
MDHVRRSLESPRRKIAFLVKSTNKLSTNQLLVITKSASESIEVRRILICFINSTFEPHH